MKTDEELQQEIREELIWEARINDPQFNIYVNEGHVTLSGEIDSYPKKMSAERAAKKVNGVKNVFNELRVVLPIAYKRSDKEIARAVLNSIKWNSSVDDKKIKVNVKDGAVVLEGKVEWEYQSSKAALLAEDIAGVVNVVNQIEVVPANTSSDEVKNKITEAFKRNYYMITNRIRVDVSNGRAILSGKVRNLAEKIVAETAAWSATGINEVVNDLTIEQGQVLV